LSASDDGTIKLWDIESNECMKTYQANIGIVSCVKYVATGNKIISGYFNGTLKIWNMENDECIKTIDSSHTREIRNILIISNNKFVTCSLDQTIKLFDLNTFECIRTFHVNEIGVTNIDKLSNNKIASCSKGFIRIWKLDNEKCFKSIRACRVKNIKTFSLQKIISQDFDEIKIWNVVTGLCLKAFRININILNSNYFTCIVKLSSQEIAIGQSSGTIKIYNKTYDKCLKAFTSLSLNINNNQKKPNTNWIWYLAKLSKNSIASCQSSNYTIEIRNTDSDNCLKKLSGHKDLVTFIDLF
jgi:WD40 repeat protein